MCMLIVASLSYYKKINNLAKEYSFHYGLDRSLVLAIVKVESNFNSRAVSEANCKGLMQISEQTFVYVCKMYNLSFSYNEVFRPEVNLNVGCAYLNYLFQRFSSKNEVLCAYNAGEGRVSSWLSNPAYSKNGKTLDYIPFAETREYLSKVLDYQKKIR